MRVLVIEDNASLRDVVRLALEAAGHEVLTATQGLEGLAYLNGHPVDLVLTDLFMPEMDGIEVIAALRRQFPGVPMRAMAIFGLPARREDIKPVIKKVTGK